MSSSSHVQELLLEKEKVNEVRNAEFITFGVFVCLHKTGNANQNVEKINKSESGVRSVFLCYCFLVLLVVHPVRDRFSAKLNDAAV